MTTFKPLSLRKTVGSTYNTDFDDILNIKKAMRDIGLYQGLSDEVTPYGDEPLFNAIRRFQEVTRLQVDGVVKPDGN
ncbi:peptidoglycan-binding domain-containing protein [Thalassospiraceae bacterium LMO-SO8]|nr:peptidoglycan-binding protein [Alphaproteobacteria bacterium LMO-S08]WND77807.1 peptidoglycan-binding domain-containing protein [Thalassospiraceae bacterium LMO-SO8]